MTDLLLAPRPWHTYKQRVHPISLILIHATRGHTTLAMQDDATLNWFGNAPDRGGWGPTADVLVSADEDKVWEFGNVQNQRSNWSAGYGSFGRRYEWGADEHALSIEIASRVDTDFTDETIERAAWYVRKRMKDWNLAIPIVRIPYWSQRRTEQVPAGFIGHEDTANGRKSVKTDPGDGFPWDRFLDLVKSGGLSEPLTAADLGTLWMAFAPGLPSVLRPGGVRQTPLKRRNGRRVIEVELP